MRHSPALSCVVLALLAHLAASQPPPADLPPGKKLVTFDGQLWRARWSQDGRTVATSTMRLPKDKDDLACLRFKTVELWDAVTGKRLHSLGELEIPNYPFLYLSADGTRLVISQGFFLSAGEIEVWDAKRATLERGIPVEPRPRPMECLAVSAKGELIAEAFGDPGGRTAAEKRRSGSIDLYDAATGKKVRTLRDEKGMAQAVIFVPGGRAVITRNVNNVVRLWDIKTGKLIREARAPEGSTGELAMSPDGRRLVIPVGKHGALQVWSVPELKPLGTIRNPFETVMRAEFSPSGKRLLVAGFRDESRGADTKGGVMVWDVERNRLLHYWKTPSAQCGFCGEEHLGVAERGAIVRYPVTARKDGEGE